MRVTTVTWSNPALPPRASTRTLVDRQPEGQGPAVLSVARAEPGTAKTATPIKILSEGHLGKLVAAGSKAKAADEGVAFLLERVNSANPAQVSAFMLRNHLASSQTAAQSHADTIIGAVQSKEGGSVLLGVRAGVATFVVVDSIKPEWSLARKITISVVVAALVSAALLFGLKDKDKPTPAAVRQNLPAAQR